MNKKEARSGQAVDARYFVDEDRVEELYQLWRDTGEDAYHEELFLIFAPTVRTMCLNLRKEALFDRIPMEELEAEAWAILAGAVAAYNPEKGTLGGAFFTRLRFRLRENCVSLVRMNEYKIGSREMARYYKALKEGYGFPCYVENLIVTDAIKGKITLDFFQELHRAMKERSSAPLDVIEYTPHSSPWESIEADAVSEAAPRLLAPLLATLSPEERLIISHTYGLDGHAHLRKITELQEETGISRGKVKRLQDSAMEKLVKGALGGGSSALKSQFEALKLLRTNG